jgi:hypothetical protein
MKLDELRKDDELKAQAPQAPTTAGFQVTAPPRAASRDVLPPSQEFLPPTPQSTTHWDTYVPEEFRDMSGIQAKLAKGCVHTYRDGFNWDRAASQAFEIPMKVIDERKVVEAEDILTCHPLYEGEHDIGTTSEGFKRLPMRNISCPVAVKIDLEGQVIDLRVSSTAPPNSVAATASLKLGRAIESKARIPMIWTSNWKYAVQKTTSLNVPGISAETRANLIARTTEEIRVTITMRAGGRDFRLENVLISKVPAMRDVVNTWWMVVAARQLSDPILTLLPQDVSECDLHGGDGQPMVEIVQDMEIVAFLHFGIVGRS